MAKRKRRKKTPLRKLEIKADKALSEYCRELTRLTYGVCPICNERPIAHCFHFIPRKRKILRWDIRNVVGSCPTCNFVENQLPDISRAWFIREKGVELYLSLVDESKQYFESTEEYLQGIISKYTQALADLQNPPKTP